ncbi:hypothetical protein [Bacillus sp. J33]|uniref:hypothetical protein n=1 Tax=Bacillus sp. J33 TaxID=935836 RepID=UPI00047EB802|nr:hypothetical protein [Bacillus sp. J33]
MQNQNSKTGADSTMQSSVEQIWQKTCGSWENFNESTVQEFLNQCEEKGIDSQFAMSWAEQNKDQVPNWQTVSRISLNWMNQHTSTGSPIVNDNVK